MSKETKVEGPRAKQNFPHTALSIRENPATKRWELIVVKYNVEYKASYIESVEDVSENKSGAIERFKIRAYELGLV